MDRIRIAGALLSGAAPLDVDGAALVDCVVRSLDPDPWRSVSLVSVVVGVPLLTVGDPR